MRIGIILLLMILLDIYVYQVVRYLSAGQTDWIKWVWRGSFWTSSAVALVLVFCILQGYAESWPKNVLTYTRTFLFIFYFSKLFFAVFILIDDLRRLGSKAYQFIAGTEPFNPSRSKFLTNTALVVGFLPFTSLLYGIIRNPYRYKIYSTKIKMPEIKLGNQSLRIVQISDIHAGSFTFKEPVKLAIEMINDLQPDLVFFTGDMVNNKAEEMLPYVDIFQKIKSKYGVYSTLGNHDYGDYAKWANSEEKQQNLQQLKDIHRMLGWDLLMNENRILDIGGKQIAVIGVENYSAIPRFPRLGDLRKAHKGTEGADIKLLLSHDPSHWDYQVKTDYKDIDLTFSGHTHGFQFGIEIPGYFSWSPSQYVYKQWAGIYQSGEQYLNVNRGLGFLGYPGRVGILPEITCIDLDTAI
ncbi:MAG: metallophosphoesterase [Saprospiraceae bacterium]|nr:metallophosphoesterase [Saprospiraceae bacterium]